MRRASQIQQSGVTLPSMQQSGTGSQRQQEVNDQLFHRVQEMFDGKIEAEVVFMVLQEFEFNVHRAVESLSQMCGEVLDVEAKKSRLAMIAKDVLCADNSERRSHQSTQNLLPSEFPALSSSNQVSNTPRNAEGSNPTNSQVSMAKKTQILSEHTLKADFRKDITPDQEMSAIKRTQNDPVLGNISGNSSRIRQFSNDGQKITNSSVNNRNIGVIGERPSRNSGDNNLTPRQSEVGNTLDLSGFGHDVRSRSAERPVSNRNFASTESSTADIDYWLNAVQQSERKSLSQSESDIKTTEFPSFHESNTLKSASDMPTPRHLFQQKKDHNSLDDIDDFNDELEFSRSKEHREISRSQANYNFIGQSILSGALKLSDSNHSIQVMDNSNTSTGKDNVACKTGSKLDKSVEAKKNVNDNKISQDMTDYYGNVTIDSYWLPNVSTSSTDGCVQNTSPSAKNTTEKVKNSNNLLECQRKEGFVSPVNFMETAPVTDFVRDSVSPGFSRYSFANKSKDMDVNKNADSYSFLGLEQGKNSGRHDSSDFDDIDKILKESYSNVTNFEEENDDGEKLGANKRRSESVENPDPAKSEYCQSKSAKKLTTDLKNMLKISGPNKKRDDEVKGNSGKMQLPVVSFELSAHAKEFVPRFQKQDTAVEVTSNAQPTFLTPKMMNSQQEKVISTVSSPRMPALPSGYPSRVPFSVPVASWPSPRGSVGRGIPWPPPALPPPPFPTFHEPPPPIGNQSYLSAVKKPGLVHQQQVGANKKSSLSVMEESSLVSRVKKRILDGFKCLVLLRGLPGSGKSTLARELQGDGQILSTDDYFTKNGVYQYDPSKLPTAHDWNRQRAISAFEEALTPIIIDNTNTQVWEMKPYIKLAKTYGYDIEILEPNTDWKFNIKELAKRNKHGVSQETIQRMKDRYQWNVTIDSILGNKKSKSEKKTMGKNQEEDISYLDIRADVSESEFPRIKSTLQIPASKEIKRNGQKSYNGDQFMDKDVGWGDEFSSFQSELENGNSGWGDPMVTKDKNISSLENDILSHSSDDMESERGSEKKSELRQSPVPAGTTYVRSAVGVSPVNLHKQLEMITKRKMLMSPPVMSISPALKTVPKEIQSEKNLICTSSSASTTKSENLEDTCDEVERIVNDVIREHVGGDLKAVTDYDKTVDELKAFLHIMPIDPAQRSQVENMIEIRMKEMTKKRDNSCSDDKTQEDMPDVCNAEDKSDECDRGNVSDAQEESIQNMNCFLNDSDCKKGEIDSLYREEDSDVSVISDDKVLHDLKEDSTTTQEKWEIDADSSVKLGNNLISAEKDDVFESCDEEIYLEDNNLPSQRSVKTELKGHKEITDLSESEKKLTENDTMATVVGDKCVSNTEYLAAHEVSQENREIDEIKSSEAKYWNRVLPEESLISLDSTEEKNDDNFMWNDPKPRRQNVKTGRVGVETNTGSDKSKDNNTVNNSFYNSLDKNKMDDNNKENGANITTQKLGVCKVENDESVVQYGCSVTSTQSSFRELESISSSSQNHLKEPKTSPSRNDYSDASSTTDTLESISGQTTPKKKRKTSKRKMAAKLPFFNESDVQKFADANWLDLSTMSSVNKMKNMTYDNQKCDVKNLNDFSSEITDEDLALLNLVNTNAPIDTLDKSTKILLCRNRDINRESSMDSSTSSKDGLYEIRPYIQSKWTVDRGVMTEEPSEASLEFLKKSFPSLNEQDLKDVVQQCGDDMLWAANLLLDWNYDLHLTKEDKQRFVEAMCKVQGLPVSRTIPSKIESTYRNLKPKSLVDLCCGCLESCNIASKSDIEQQIITSGKRRLNSIEEKIRRRRVNSYEPDDEIFEEDDEFGEAILQELVAMVNRENSNNPDLGATAGISVKNINENVKDRTVNLSLTVDCPESDSFSVWDYQHEKLIGQPGYISSGESGHIESLANENSHPSKEDEDLDVSRHSHPDSLLPLTLPAMFTQALISLFGPVEGLHSGNFGDISVMVDYKTAKSLHKCITKGFNQEGIQQQQLLEDEALARKLQAEMNESNAMATNLGWYDNSTSRETQSFEDIMREQRNAEDRKRELGCTEHEVRPLIPDCITEIEQNDMNATGSYNLLATRLKKKQLYEEFPGIDESVLDDIFQANCYQLQDTVKAIRGFLGSNTTPPRNVMTQEASEEYERKLIQAAKQQSLQEMMDSCLYRPRVSKNFQATENPEYEDFRAEANIHYRLRHECFQKAQEAFRRGMRQVATFYSDQGHLHTQKIKESNMRAAEKILSKRNNALKNNSTLDLHGLHVDEAITSLERVITQREYELESHPDKRKEHIFIITGRGAHSRGGVARIKPCVISYLKRNNYRYTEVHQGLLKINLRTRISQ